jgi:sulfonate transport system substrate-binding protein
MPLTGGGMEENMIKRKISQVLAVVIVLVLSLSACSGKSTTTASKDTAAQVPTGNTKSNEADLSKVTLRFGSTGWELQKELLKAAGVDDTPYKVEYSTFQGGNLCLEEWQQIRLI